MIPPYLDMLIGRSLELQAALQLEGLGFGSLSMYLCIYPFIHSSSIYHTLELALPGRGGGGGWGCSKSILTG